MIRMDLVKIVIREMNDHQLIFLKEADGERAFPIVIGLYEAAAIDRKVKGIETARPMTHDLVGNLLDAMGAKLERIVVTKLEANTFFARLHVMKNGETVEVDSRPSDAVALAVHAGAPIFVDEQVLNDVLKS
jgi:hypothetical protein